MCSVILLICFRHQLIQIQYYIFQRCSYIQGQIPSILLLVATIGRVEGNWAVGMKGGKEK